MHTAIVQYEHVLGISLDDLVQPYTNARERCQIDRCRIRIVDVESVKVVILGPGLVVQDEQPTPVGGPMPAAAAYAIDMHSPRALGTYMQCSSPPRGAGPGDSRTIRREGKTTVPVGIEDELPRRHESGQRQFVEATVCRRPVATNERENRKQCAR